MQDYMNVFASVGVEVVSGPFHSKTSRHGNCCTHLKELWQNYIVFTLKGGCSSNSFPSWVFPDFKIVFMTSLQSNPTGLEISSHWTQSFYFSWPAIDSFTGTQVWLTLVLFEKFYFSFEANKLPLPKNSHIHMYYDINWHDKCTNIMDPCDTSGELA